MITWLMFLSVHPCQKSLGALNGSVLPDYSMITLWNRIILLADLRFSWPTLLDFWRNIHMSLGKALELMLSLLPVNFLSWSRELHIFSVSKMKCWKKPETFPQTRSAFGEAESQWDSSTLRLRFQKGSVSHVQH